MVIAKQIEIRNNIKKYFDLAYEGDIRLSAVVRSLTIWLKVSVTVFLAGISSGDCGVVMIGIPRASLLPSVRA